MITIAQICDLYTRGVKNRLYRGADDKLLILAEKKGELFPKLSHSEIEEIKRVWPCFHVDRFNTLSFNRLTKRENGFSPYYINTVQIHALLDEVNRQEQVTSLTNKAMCDVFLPEIAFPEVFVRCIGGIYYNRKMERITYEDAIKELMGHEMFIMKPSIGSSGGAGVRKVKTEDKTTLAEIIQTNCNEWVAQEVLQQEPIMASMNPSSVNSCRITTIYLKGRFGYSACVKIGKKGSNIDNWFTSYFVGLSSDGKMNEFGYDKQLNKVDKTDGGVNIKGMKVPFFDKMLYDVERWHKYYFPMCGIVGWDIMVDISGIPRVIETNLTHPGVIAEQLVSGPFFEPFHDVICDLVNKRRWA